MCFATDPCIEGDAAHEPTLSGCHILGFKSVEALVLHNHIVQYAARAYDVLHVTQVIDAHWELQDPKALVKNAEHPLYYFAHGLAPA